jgi:uncharacterized membrane protein YoaK (UPF0700 family)
LSATGICMLSTVQALAGSGPEAMTPWLSVRLWLPVILSTTAGAVDVTGFLALGGLFTAHLTGNLVIVAAHYTTGGFSKTGPLLAVPIFAVVLVGVALLFGGLDSRSHRRALLVLHAVLLAGCLGLGLRFGPFANANAPIAVLTGMVAVAAMATQSAMVRLALVESPSTAVMTTNMTQLFIDLVAVARRQGEPGDLDKARSRARVTFACVTGFFAGGAAGAVLESRIGLGVLVLPVILAAMAVPLGELKERPI